MSVLIIAEIGVNHDGSLEKAFELVNAAHAAGVDVCKFQLFSPQHADGKYEHLRLSREQIKQCEEYCKRFPIKFACTAFDVNSLEWLLANTDRAFVKIGSGQATDVDLLLKASNSGLTIIQSCTYGMSGMDGCQYLHVVPEYPTPSIRANLKFFANDIKSGHRHGLSDHSGDIFIPLAAVALGAKIIECHITLDKNSEGPDHKASLTPDQFKELVRGIRAIELGLQ